MKSLRRSSCTPLALWFLVSVHSFHVTHPSTRQAFVLLRASDDNDGWNDENVAMENKIEENMQLLKSLQENPPSTSPSETERDMFIPIVTLVSIAGFTGAYCYEMLKLYSRGELYLPF